MIIRPSEDEDPEALFESICRQFDSNRRIEQDSEGNVRIMPPAGGESSDQNSELTAQLNFWARRDGRGRAFDSSVCFRLPDKRLIHIYRSDSDEVQILENVESVEGQGSVTGFVLDLTPIWKGLQF